MITFENVSKRYGGFTAVDDVSFVARSGRVTGFLGPNGAGKSTSMRIMAGLTLPDHGVATIGGHAYADIPNPGRHVGVLLDASAQHAGRTGREVLALTAMTMGLPGSSVDEMLETVGLTPTEAKRRVKNYSLGMRQRLGIANALIGKPSVLILDEPANGLDPAGIHWMRGLLRQFAADGGTVLLSSHLLHEVEMIADDMVLIGRGKIVAQGSKQELLQTAGTFVRGEDPQLLAKVLADAGITATASGDGGLRTEVDPIEIGRAAAAAGVVLVELRPAEGAGLEEMFLQLTASDARESVNSEGAAA
ncbi:ABC transporter ATP-binding protein [Luteimicrobium subarcticum]|uniref:ABC-2 type transport system ATP-binding protein n=1 Tax=Luteimicrobium subarcticum TaxID=620910 RepID=A0A2M8W709_9MICO|nr:ATP-binding cassette domain-containing protein [Luteimicrobium subarcticum]PJI86715.1 ABC-2 type transport system ATP-binding protein [Luteimicrobium subarcticum]